MKTKIILLSVVLSSLFIIPAKSQWIQSLTVLPANPTPNDTITLLAELSFPAGSCDNHTQSVSIVGNNIYANALHCLGVLTIICDYTDTFKVAPLQAGNYTFHFHVDAGALPAPCTPGINPGPSVSVTFVVSPTVGISDPDKLSNAVIYPNPAGDQFNIMGISESQYPVTVELFTTTGARISELVLNDLFLPVETAEIASGTYMVKIKLRDGESGMFPLVIRR